MTWTEMIQKLASCVALESEIIDELFLMMAMHMDADELAGLPVIEKIKDVSRIKREVGLVEKEVRYG